MTSNVSKKTKWYYQYFKELTVLLAVLSDTFEFFEKVHKLVARAIESFTKVVPAIGFIVAAVGHIAVFFQLVSKQSEKKDYAVVGARFASGLAMLALATTSLVLVQYTLPLLVATMAVDSCLALFKEWRLRSRIKQLKKQLSGLNNSPEKEGVFEELITLQNELRLCQHKFSEKLAEVAYTMVATTLVIIGMAIPVTAPIVTAVVAVAGVCFTAYRYREPIKRFFNRVGSKIKLLSDWLGFTKKLKQQSDAFPEVSNYQQQQGEQDASGDGDKQGEHESAADNNKEILETTSSQHIEEGAVATAAMDAVVSADNRVSDYQRQREFLHQQEHTLEALAVSSPHPSGFNAAHAERPINPVLTDHLQVAELEKMLHESIHSDSVDQVVSADIKNNVTEVCKADVVKAQTDSSGQLRAKDPVLKEKDEDDGEGEGDTGVSHLMRD